MRSSLHHLLGLAVVPALLSTACGSPPPPAPPPAPTAEPAPAPAPVATTTYELTPVPEPADVVGIARWKSPKATLDTFAGCAGVPVSLIDEGVRAGVEGALKGLLHGEGDAKAFASVVALDAPVDALMTLDAAQKKPVMGAFAVGLTSLERAREAAEAAGGHPLTELSPGQWKVGQVKDLQCVIAASAGSTPARLVCGGREKDLTALAPYLTRTAPTMATQGGDMHGELRFAPVDAKYGSLLRQTVAQLPLVAQSEVSIGDPEFDKAVLDAATGLADEVIALSGDLDKLVLDFATGSPICFKGSHSLLLRGKKSWLAQGISERLDLAGAPSAIFWRLPKDAETATYTRGADPARYQGMLKTARALVDGFLTKKNIGSAADRKALADLFTFPLKKNTAIVHANGHPNAPAAGGKAAKAGAAAEIEALMGGSVGWTLYGFDEAPAAIVKSVKDAVAVYNRGGFQGALKKELKGDAKKFLPTVKTSAGPAKLGKDSLDVEIKIANIPEPDVTVTPGAVTIKDKDHGKGKDKGRAPAGQTVTLSFHLLVMGDGDTTWVAFGVDRDELVERLLGAKSGVAPTATLSTRPGLEDLKVGRTLSGGFLTVGYFTRAVTSGISKYLSKAKGSDAEAKEIVTMLGGLPHKGETPILLTSTAAPEGAGTRGDFVVSVPKGAVEDVASLVMNVARASASHKH